MKNTLPLFALAPAALAVAALALLPAPAAAKTKRSHKMHAKKHTQMHTKKRTMTRRVVPAGVSPAHPGFVPNPANGTGTVPNAVGDAGSVTPPSPPVGGGVTR